MSCRNKVVWSQGMFLQPQHFQQETRYLEHLVDMRQQAAGLYAWGFFELVIDDGLLALGRLAIVRASGVLPDGTPFAIPQLNAAPPPLEVPSDMKGELAVLAVPMAREGVTDVDFDDTALETACRYRAGNEDLRDHTNAGDDPEPVQTGVINLRLLRARDTTDAHAKLGIARVLERRNDNAVTLDRAYIAPQTRIDASAQLTAHAALVHGLVQQRARLIAARMGQLSHGVSEVADFLMLQTLNRAEPELRQMAGAPSVHPQHLHTRLLQLAGELATFTSELRLPGEYPLYKHEDLQATFAPLVADLRRLLSAVLENATVQLELVDRSHGVRTAVADAELVRTANFVLAARAQMPGEQLRQRFPAQSKLGPVDRIRDLVNYALPGVALHSLPVAPRQLPFHAGSHYFEIERNGELWKQIELSGNFALHVAGEFPGLELELWAIRQ